MNEVVAYLLAFWSFTTGLDDTCQNIPATPHGTVECSEAGCAFTPPSYLVGDDGYFQDLTEFTIFVRFRPAANIDAGSTQQTLLASNRAHRNHGDWWLGFGLSDGQPAHLEFGSQSQNQACAVNKSLRSATILWNGGQTYDATVTGSAEGLSLFINGRLDATTDTCAYIGSGGPPLAIGGNAFDRGGIQYYTGEIMAVGFWRRALSPSEVASMAANFAELEQCGDRVNSP